MHLVCATHTLATLQAERQEKLRAAAKKRMKALQQELLAKTQADAVSRPLLFNYSQACS